jgi:hypothetical protein
VTQTYPRSSAEALRPVAIGQKAQPATSRRPFTTAEAMTTRRGALVPRSHRRSRPQARRLNAPGFSFAVVGRGELLMLLLPFKAMLLSERARGRKSGSPPLFAPSFKVQRNTAHNESSGLAVLPLCDDLNAHRVRKVPRESVAGCHVPADRRRRTDGPLAGRTGDSLRPGDR